MGTPQYPVKCNTGTFRRPYAATPVPSLNISVVKEVAEILLLNVKRLSPAYRLRPSPETFIRNLQFSVLLK